MQYPLPKRYREYVLKPFAKPKTVTALHGVDMQIERGDRVAFMGANGAGKTTLLKLIGGLLYPSSGSIQINGKDTVKNNLHARLSVGYVLNEERSFYWRLSGRQNLRFFGALDNLHGADLEKRIDELLGLVEMDEAADVRVSNYSSGMKQRLAIARGLLADPEILILDEPTRTLDPIGAEKIKRLIMDKVHAEEKRALLIATHRIEEATELCNKVVVIKKGRILAYERKEDILKEYADLGAYYKAVNGEEMEVKP